MMKNLLLLFLTILSIDALSQEFKLKTGTEFGYNNVIIEKGTFPGKQEYEFHFKVLGKDDSQNHKLSCTLVRMKTRIEWSKDFISEFNSDELRKIKLNSTSPLLPLSILQKPFFVILSPKGKFLRLEGVDTLIINAVSQWQLGKDREKEMRENSSSFPLDIVQNLFLALPETKPSLGSEWSSADGTSIFKVTGIKGALLIIENTAKPGAEIADNGIVSWNTAMGLTEAAERSWKGAHAVSAGSTAIQLNKSSTQKLLHTIQGSPALDTSWINMAVKMSYWSEALKKGTEYDSVKVFKFLEAGDLLYDTDPYYAIRKLALLQNFRGPRINNNYEKQLLKTPNHFIAEEYSHLHNKLGDVLSHSADSAYAVAKYLYKSPTFNDWVQHSYAQDFIRPAFTESAKASRKKQLKSRGYDDEEIEEFFRESEAEIRNGNKLLELLNNDKDPLMQKKVRPLYLWVKAKESNNAAYLVNTAHALKKLDESYVQEGNGARYSLLVYKLLNNTAEKSTAQSLLNHTIKQLEKLSVDTLNAQRYAHQNLLAGAYYMKYLSEKHLDSVKALKYLSKASEYSPKSKKENAHGSFYDRVFLDTKESYRKEFLARLFNNGNKEEALNVFITHLNSNPGELKEMAELYEANFPGENFREFFGNNIISSWDTAPAFVLKGLKGEEYNLKNYAGKWLVLDFWGTWCAPCRQEMPDINKFNTALRDGKYKDLEFLSIACSDTESKVTSYLGANKFDIPAAMSDNKVEKTYKILGYPSKIIIAPNGKMLQLNFQHDWRTIAASFSQLSFKE